MDRILINKISKTYGDKEVLKNLELTFDLGLPNFIMGSSGRGKTTLINILLGITEKDGGEIIIERGKEKEIWSVKKERPAAVFQEDRLCEEFSVSSNIMMVMKKSKTDREKKEKCMRILSGLNIKEYANQRVCTLSGGQKRRVALARAIAYPSSILIMDEPFRGLDRENKYSVMQYIKESTKGKTLIIVTHDKEDAEYFERRAMRI